MCRLRNIAGGCFLAMLGSLVSVDRAQAGSEKVIYSFTGGADGANPDSRPVMDSGGKFYGTTFAGGASDAGTVFKVTPHGVETVLYSFTGGSDGGFPTGDLIIGSDGSLYGTTEGGGDSGFGTVFRLTTKGKESVLYSFTGGDDGATPVGGVIMDGSENIYGTTMNGGAGSFGTVFKLTPTGEEQVLHAFVGSDGANPQSSLIMDADGNFYGTTVLGGALNQGIVFRMKPGGKIKVLHSFDGGTDGRFPSGPLILDSAGNFYGETQAGGAGIAGTVFELTSKRKLKVLHAFTGGDDGGNPFGGLVMDDTGALFGATSSGGSGASVGTVFTISPGGKEKVLHSFDAAVDLNDGSQPSSGVTLDTSGDLFGVTSQGGGSGQGSVYKVKH